MHVLKPLMSLHQISTLHHKKLLHQWLAFSGPHLKISRLFHDIFQHLLQDFSGPEKSKDEFQDQWEPCTVIR